MSTPVYAVYARPQDVKVYLENLSSSTSYDALLLDLCEQARAKIDTYCRRHFWPKVETRYFDAKHLSYELDLDDDLISVTTLTNGDSTTIAAADYYLYPPDGPPYVWIEIKKDEGIIFQYSTTYQKAITVAGTWGYDEITVASGTTVNDAAGLAIGATSITPSAIASFYVGDLLKIESEYFYVTAKGDTALTVVPSVNGSTGATHAKTTAISFVRFPDDIVHIATRLAMWYFKQRDAPFEKTANPALGTLTIPSAIPKDIAEDLESWQRAVLL